MNEIKHQYHAFCFNWKGKIQAARMCYHPMQPNAMWLEYPTLTARQQTALEASLRALHDIDDDQVGGLGRVREVIQPMPEFLRLELWGDDE